MSAHELNASAHDRLGWWSAERTFMADLDQVRVARAWLREVFASGCLLLDDSLTVLSELLANCAVHGGGGEVTATVTHTCGGVLGTLIHNVPPKGTPELVPEVLDEIGSLLRAPVGLVADTAGLSESGRGLALVVALCEGSVDIDQRADRTVIGWTLDGCDCEGDDR